MILQKKKKKNYCNVGIATFKHSAYVCCTLFHVQWTTFTNVHEHVHHLHAHVPCSCMPLRGNTMLECTLYCCRETEWLFSSDPGRRQLAESAGFERLVIVTLHRGHTYSSLDAVKEEVAGKAVELVQQGLPHGKQVHV